MTPSAAKKRLARRNLLNATIARFAPAERIRIGQSSGDLERPTPGRGRPEHRRSPKKVSLLRRITRRLADSAPDPVALVVLAIDRLGPAAVRACASGAEVCVAAPDEATAAVFRAALAETERHRRTDRLIRVLVG